VEKMRLLNFRAGSRLQKTTKTMLCAFIFQVRHHVVLLHTIVGT